jgi:RNA-directed DNA polymerase
MIQGGIAELAREDKQMKFTSLAHLLNVENLTQCHHELPVGKATRVLGETKERYGINLTENLERLVEDMKAHQYQPVPVRGKPISRKMIKEIHAR